MFRRAGFLMLLLFLAGPAAVVARAQTGPRQGTPLDAWRRRLSARLDEDLVRLEAADRHEPPPESVVGWNHTQGKPSPPSGPLGARQAWVPTVANILREQGLPAALLGVAAVESGFDPQALSPKGALGLWQLMPETARHYGLVVDSNKDERLEPRKSTYVAARYLSDLYAQFHDWLLTLAAYNAGEGRVQDAIARFSTRDFWALSRQRALPEETRRYVPAVLQRSAELGETSAAQIPGSFPSGLTSGTAFEPAATHIVFALTSPVPAGIREGDSPENSF